MAERNKKRGNTCQACTVQLDDLFPCAFTAAELGVRVCLQNSFSWLIKDERVAGATVHCSGF
jgi:hypothetical protein